MARWMWVTGMIAGLMAPVGAAWADGMPSTASAVPAPKASARPVTTPWKAKPVAKPAAKTTTKAVAKPVPSPKPTAAPSARSLAVPIAPSTSIRSGSVTRREFVEAMDRWLRGFEQLTNRSFENPKETVLLYQDLTGAFKETAIDLETRYRLFEGVDGFQYGIFDANKPLTRLQTAQLLANLVTLIEHDGLTKNLDVRRPGNYSDLHDMDNREKDINLLTSRGIMSGFSGGQFLPDEPLGRLQYEYIQSNFLQYLDRVKKAI